MATAFQSAAEAAAAVNGVVDSYLAADVEWSDGMTKNQIKNLETYRSSLQGQVEERQKAWLDLAARGNAWVDPAPGRDTRGETSNVSLSIEEYKRARSQLLECPLELAEAEAAQEYRPSRSADVAGEGADPSLVLEARIAAAFRQDPDASRILGEIDQLGLEAKLA